MDDKENLGAFFRNNKNLAKDYFQIQMEIYRLRFVAAFSKSAGYLIWIIISLLLLFLFFLFVWIVAGFWFSELTGSYIKGFGLVALIILLKIILLSMMRKSLFVNPIIRSIINHSQKETTEKKEEQFSKP